MALHQLIQRLLLLGVRFESLPRLQEPTPPARLAPLIESIAPEHRTFDLRAVHFGHRYRSGYWAIYVLSAFAVLFAVVPLALGWDDSRHILHPFVGLWEVGEVLVIATVGAIYWLGHRRDWQGQWLQARTTAELTWYLPLVAPLVDFQGDTAVGDRANWYRSVYDPGEPLPSASEVETLCRRHDAMARKNLQDCWSDPTFVAHYAHWTIDILEGQRRYHLHVAQKQHALLSRVHGLNSWLFGLTAVGASMHLMMHTLWLSLVTTFFPALGASLHGALAQSEAYRLSVTSERLVTELHGAIARIRRTIPGIESLDAASIQEIKITIQAAVAQILKEHQDWHMLVRPHHLPLG